MAQGSSSAENGKLGGRPKGSLSKERAAALAYRQALLKEALKHKKKLSEVLVKKAIDGDIPAIKEIHDRLLGKAVQPISGDEDQPIVLRIDF